jgi:hypothetical protein
MCRSARRTDAHPSVLRQTDTAGLERQPVAGGEPRTVFVAGPELREPPLSSKERLMGVARIPERVPERPRRVLTGPRGCLGLLGSAQLGQREEGQRSDSVRSLDAVGGFGGPLVGVGLDLRHRPVEREPPGLSGALQRAGLDVGDVPTDLHRAVAHELDGAGRVGQFTSPRS